MLFLLWLTNSLYHFWHKLKFFKFNCLWQLMNIKVPNRQSLTQYNLWKARQQDNCCQVSLLLYGRVWTIRTISAHRDWSCFHWPISFQSQQNVNYVLANQIVIIYSVKKSIYLYSYYYEIWGTVGPHSATVKNILKLVLARKVSIDNFKCSVALST